jgi:hypothetical protein
MNNDGITVMTQSYNPYSFNEEGMSKAGQGGLSYKVRGVDGCVFSAADHAMRHATPCMLHPPCYISMQISEKDIRILRRLGAGASSVVFKGFLFKENKFVAVKKINVFERVGAGRAGAWMLILMTAFTLAGHAAPVAHQMMNGIKALCGSSLRATY